MTKIELQILTLRKLVEKDKHRLVGLKDQKLVAIIKRKIKTNTQKLNTLLLD